MSQFNPLNGAELKKVILAQIEKEMDDSGDFQANITYPWLKYTFEIKMNSYPKFAFDAEPVVVAKGGDSLSVEVPSTEDDTKETLISGGTSVDTPDQARVDAELPIPTPTPTVHQGIVDKPVIQQKPKGK